MFSNAGNSSISRRYGSRHTNTRQSNQANSESIRLTPPKPVFIVSGPLSAISATAQTSLNSTVRKGKWTTDVSKSEHSNEPAELKLAFHNLLNQPSAYDEKRDETKSSDRLISEITVQSYQKNSNITRTSNQNVWTTRNQPSGENFDFKPCTTPNEFPDISESLPNQSNELKKKVSSIYKEDNKFSEANLNMIRIESNKMTPLSSFPLSNPVISQFAPFQPMHYQPISPLRADGDKLTETKPEEADEESNRSFEANSTTGRGESTQNVDTSLHLKTNKDSSYKIDLLTANATPLSTNLDSDRKKMSSSWAQRKESLNGDSVWRQAASKKSSTGSSKENMYFELDWLESDELTAFYNLDAALSVFKASKLSQSYESTQKPKFYMQQCYPLSPPSQQTLAKPALSKFSTPNVNIPPKTSTKSNCVCHLVIAGVYETEADSAKIHHPNNLQSDAYKSCYTHFFEPKLPPVMRQHPSIINQGPLFKPGLALPAPIRHLSSKAPPVIDGYDPYRTSLFHPLRSNTTYDYPNPNYDMLKHKSSTPRSAAPANANSNGPIFHISNAPNAGPNTTSKAVLNSEEIICAATNEDEEEVHEFEFPSLNVDRSKLLELNGLNYHPTCHYTSSYDPDRINHYTTTYNNNSNSSYLNNNRVYLDYPKELLDRTGFLIEQFLPYYNQDDEEEEDEEVVPEQPSHSLHNIAKEVTKENNTSIKNTDLHYRIDVLHLNTQLYHDCVQQGTPSSPSSRKPLNHQLQQQQLHPKDHKIKSFNNSMKCSGEPSTNSSSEIFLKEKLQQTNNTPSVGGKVSSSVETVPAMSKKGAEATGAVEIPGHRESKCGYTSTVGNSGAPHHSDIMNTPSKQSNHHPSYLQACMQRKRTTKKSRGNSYRKALAPNNATTATTAGTDKNLKALSFPHQQQHPSSSQKAGVAYQQGYYNAKSDLKNAASFCRNNEEKKAWHHQTSRSNLSKKDAHPKMYTKK